jgi:hypothetical protein
MSAGFDYFRFHGPMPSFQFRKMRRYGHIGGLLSQIVGWVFGRRLWRVRERNLSRWSAAMGVLAYR